MDLNESDVINETVMQSENIEVKHTSPITQTTSQVVKPFILNFWKLILNFLHLEKFFLIGNLRLIKKIIELGLGLAVA